MKSMCAVDDDDDIGQTVLQGFVDEFLVGIRDSTVKREVRAEQAIDEIDDSYIGQGKEALKNPVIDLFDDFFDSKTFFLIVCKTIVT